MDPNLAGEEWPLLVASICMGLSAFSLIWWLARTLQMGEEASADEWRYDVSRVHHLRREDWLFRLFGPIIQFLARFNRAALAEALPGIQRDINAAGLSRFWLPEEYLGRMELVGLLLAPFYGYLAVGSFGPVTGVFITMLLYIAVVYLLRRRLANKAAMRLRLIKRRLPYLLDLLTLLIEAGATFLNALAQAVEEFRGHPIAEEFGRVLADLNLGKTRAEAFSAMKDRLQDDEISSIIGSILQGEELGTPIAHVFRMQADVLRIKRSQRAETIAAEAGVNMLLPAVLVMVAAALIIVGPFLLNYWSFGLFF
ncbi:MAG: type II secretion system F family protein [Thermoguttaceae bacterium]|nr:type II secretion system F family protein [Thermoguttaceae bacterium]MDW8077739.1 type II secretion system F family protein [Thermoguttaceae bacterium]